MTRSRISFNIHGQNIPDVGRLKKHLLKINPSVLLAMDNLGFLREMMVDLTDTIMIHRNYGITNGDDDVHIKVTPARWLELRAKESEGGIYLYTTNEPAFDQKSIQWHIELMELAAKQGVRLVIGNWAVGNPGPDDWGQAKRMLELLDQHRDLFILGLHEYACGIITSGLYGGYPNNAGVQPGTPGGQDLVPKDKWPSDVSKITQWHCGRFNFLVNYCKKNNIKPPRIVITEHGFDDVSDIKGWAEKLEKTAKYASIRGWKSLKTQWDKWFNPIGWSAERGYFEQLKWADQTIYQNSVVEGQCTYCWGHSSEVWDQFDVAEASEFQKLLEAYAQAVDAPISTPPHTTSPLPDLKPDTLFLPHSAIIGDLTKHNVRTGRTTKHKIVSVVGSKNVLTIYEPVFTRIDTDKDETVRRWQWVETTIDETLVAGWLCIDGVKFDVPHAPVDSTPVPEVTIPPSTTLPPEPPSAPDDTPMLKTYRIPLIVEVTTTSQEAAEAVAEQSLAAARFNWQMFFEMQKVYPYLDSIKDVQFKVELP